MGGVWNVPTAAGKAREIGGDISVFHVCCTQYIVPPPGRDSEVGLPKAALTVPPLYIPSHLSKRKLTWAYRE